MIEQRYSKSDEEVAGYYLSAIGLKGQNYEPTFGAFDANEAAIKKLSQMRWLEGLRRSDMEWLTAVEDTLAKLPREHRHTLHVVYAAHGWPTWLASRLAPPWGGGSLVLLAAASPRASQASGGVGVPSVLQWLQGRGAGASDALFKNLADDAEVQRIEALAAYDEIRRQRVRQEAKEESERKAAHEAAALERESERAAFNQSDAAKLKRKLARINARERMPEWIVSSSSEFSDRDYGEPEVLTAQRGTYRPQDLSTEEGAALLELASKGKVAA